MPRHEPPWLIEAEEQTAMMVPVAEVTMLERHVAKPEHEVAVAEVEHQTALAEVTEVSRLELWDMSELGYETTAAEVPEMPRLERTMLSKDATVVVELEAMVSHVQLRPRVRREMARTEASVTCLSWLRRHCHCRHDSCEQHDFAHRRRS